MLLLLSKPSLVLAPGLALSLVQLLVLLSVLSLAMVLGRPQSAVKSSNCSALVS